MVHFARFMLAAGVARPDLISNRMAVVAALPDRGNCGCGNFGPDRSRYQPSGPSPADDQQPVVKVQHDPLYFHHGLLDRISFLPVCSSGAIYGLFARINRLKSSREQIIRFHWSA